MSDYETHYMESERALRKSEAEVERLRTALVAAEATWRQRCEGAEGEIERLRAALREARTLLVECDTSLGVPDVGFIDAALSGEAP